MNEREGGKTRGIPAQVKRLNERVTATEETVSHLTNVVGGIDEATEAHAERLAALEEQQAHVTRRLTRLENKVDRRK